MASVASESRLLSVAFHELQTEDNKVCSALLQNSDFEIVPRSQNRLAFSICGGIVMHSPPPIVPRHHYRWLPVQFTYRVHAAMVTASKRRALLQLIEGIAIQLQPMMNGRFSEGLLWVEHNSGQKMALNTEGDVVIELQIPDQPVYWVQNFSEGLAGFGAGQAGCGFVDKDGNIAIETRFSDVRQFSEGVAAVEMEGLWGFINTDGQSVIPTIFEEVKRFSHGFAAVKTSKADVSWTYVNKDGSLLTEETFFDALPFHDGVALIARSDDEFHSILYSDGSTVEIPVKSHAW